MAAAGKIYFCRFFILTLFWSSIWINKSKATCNNDVCRRIRQHTWIRWLPNISHEVDHGISTLSLTCSFLIRQPINEEIVELPDYLQVSIGNRHRLRFRVSAQNAEQCSANIDFDNDVITKLRFNTSRCLFPRTSDIADTFQRKVKLVIRNGSLDDYAAQYLCEAHWDRLQSSSAGSATSYVRFSEAYRFPVEFHWNEPITQAPNNTDIVVKRTYDERTATHQLRISCVWADDRRLKYVYPNSRDASDLAEIVPPLTTQIVYYTKGNIDCGDNVVRVQNDLSHYVRPLGIESLPNFKTRSYCRRGVSDSVQLCYAVPPLPTPELTSMDYMNKTLLANLRHTLLGNVFAAYERGDADGEQRHCNNVIRYLTKATYKKYETQSRYVFSGTDAGRTLVDWHLLHDYPVSLDGRKDVPRSSHILVELPTALNNKLLPLMRQPHSVIFDVTARDNTTTLEAIPLYAAKLQPSPSLMAMWTYSMIDLAKRYRQYEFRQAEITESRDKGILTARLTCGPEASSILWLSNNMCLYTYMSEFKRLNHVGDLWPDEDIFSKSTSARQNRSTSSTRSQQWCGQQSSFYVRGNKLLPSQAVYLVKRSYGLSETDNRAIYKYHQMTCLFDKYVCFYNEDDSYMKRVRSLTYLQPDVPDDDMVSQFRKVDQIAPDECLPGEGLDDDPRERIVAYDNTRYTEAENRFSYGQVRDAIQAMINSVLYTDVGILKSPGAAPEQWLNDVCPCRYYGSVCNATAIDDEQRQRELLSQVFNYSTETQIADGNDNVTPYVLGQDLDQIDVACSIGDIRPRRTVNIGEEVRKSICNNATPILSERMISDNIAPPHVNVDNMHMRNLSSATTDGTLLYKAISCRNIYEPCLYTPLAFQNNSEVSRVRFTLAAGDSGLQKKDVIDVDVLRNRMQVTHMEDHIRIRTDLLNDTSGIYVRFPDDIQRQTNDMLTVTVYRQVSTLADSDVVSCSYLDSNLIATPMPLVSPLKYCNHKSLRPHIKYRTTVVADTQELILSVQATVYYWDYIRRGIEACKKPSVVGELVVHSRPTEEVNSTATELTRKLPFDCRQNNQLRQQEHVVDDIYQEDVYCTDVNETLVITTHIRLLHNSTTLYEVDASVNSVDSSIGLRENASLTIDIAENTTDQTLGMDHFVYRDNCFIRPNIYHPHIEILKPDNVEVDVHATNVSVSYPKWMHNITFCRETTLPFANSWLEIDAKQTDIVHSIDGERITRVPISPTAEAKVDDKHVAQYHCRTATYVECHQSTVIGGSNVDKIVFSIKDDLFLHYASPQAHHYNHVNVTARLFLDARESRNSFPIQLKSALARVRLRNRLKSKTDTDSDTDTGRSERMTTVANTNNDDDDDDEDIKCGKTKDTFIIFSKEYTFSLEHTNEFILARFFVAFAFGLVCFLIVIVVRLHVAKRARLQKKEKLLG